MAESPAFILGKAVGKAQEHLDNLDEMAEKDKEIRRLHRALRRLAILMDYGYTIEHYMGKPVEELVALVNSNEQLEHWYGENWAERYVLDALED